MKTPTKKELQKLAVAVYGKRAEVHVQRDGARASSQPGLDGDEVVVYDRPGPASRIALAAALRALAEVKRD